jgi:hypothetical protein
MSSESQIESDFKKIISISFLSKYFPVLSQILSDST